MLKAFVLIAPQGSELTNDITRNHRKKTKQIASSTRNKNTAFSAVLNVLSGLLTRHSSLRANR